MDVPDDIEPRARAGRAVRRLGHALVGRQAPAALIDEVAASVDTMAARLEAGGPPRNRLAESFGGETWRLESEADGVVGSYDDRPISGRSSPWGLDLDVHRHGDEITGVVTLGAAHEGAPERSHGGIIAALFDDVFGFVLGVLQQPAFTGELTVRYLRPTPLHRPLACTGRLAEHAGRKIWIEGDLTDVQTGEQLARGRGLFIAVDRTAMLSESARLPAPPDEAG